MKKIVIFLIFLIGIPLLSSDWEDDESNLVITGSEKIYYMANNYPKYPFFEDILNDQELYGTIENRLRINILYNFKNWLTLETAYQVAPYTYPQGISQINSITSPSISGYRLIDFDPELYQKDQNSDKPDNNMVIYHNLDRLFFTITTENWDLYVGRQAISFGSSKFINPTDIFSPFSFQELNREERYGIDAIRFKYPIGMFGELDFGYIFGKDGKFSKSAFYGRFLLPFENIKLMFIAQYFLEHTLFGIDISKSIGGAKVTFETAYVMGNYDSLNWNNDYLRVSTSWDYYTKIEVGLFVEYHYNSAGESDPDNYIKNSQTYAYKEGGVYLMGQHYLMPGLYHTFKKFPLWSIYFQSIINLNDFSTLLTPKVEYNFAENVYFDFGAIIAIGDKPISKDGFLSFQSEFGSYPNSFHISIRLYF